MKRYGYHRTSTREQHLDRGIKEITAYCEQNNWKKARVIWKEILMLYMMMTSMLNVKDRI